MKWPPCDKIDQGWRRILAWIFRIVLIAFPAASLLIDNFASAALVLGLIGAVLFLGKEDWKIDRPLKMLTLAFSALFIWSVLQWPFAGKPLLEFAGLSNTPRFLLFLPLLLLFRKLGLREREFLHAVVWGGITVGLYAIFISLSKDDRPEGCHNTIIFGDLALLLGMFSLMGTKWFQGNMAMIAFSVSSSFLTIMASFLSGTRGGWVAIPVFLVVVFNYILSDLSLWRKVALAMCALAVLVGLALSVGQVRLRLSQLFSSYEHYQDGDALSSIGLRFDMWKQAIDSFKDHPLFGEGPDSYRYESEIRHGKEQAPLVFNHPHNVFISYLASGGLVGFCVLLLFFGGSFLHALQISGGNTFAGSCCIILVSGYMVFGLTEDLFARSAFITFYTMVMPWVVSMQKPRPDTSGFMDIESAVEE
jgi:O-antigen ligase